MLGQFFLTTCIVSAIYAYLLPGPQVKSTKGEVWPKPLWQEDSGSYFQVDPQDFVFVVVGQDCDLLQKAIVRYNTIVEEIPKHPNRDDVTPALKTISQFELNLTRCCETLPYFGMDESYYIHSCGKITANSIWGMLRGMETLSQLFVPMSNGMLRISQSEIYDEPRFKYRGLMLDTARHFISVHKITQLLDAMAYNKFNVFHWHVTDDSSFPFNSTRFPELASLGAYDYTMTYSNTDVALIIEYATLRGIRVIPEFDTPAHTASWAPSHPEIMTECHGTNSGQIGPLNPTNKCTFKLLREFFTEIKSIFPDTFIHLGGDELDTSCWESNPEIQAYLEENAKECSDLPYMYFEKFAANITRLGRTPMLWQEAILQNPGIKLPMGTIAQIWYNSASALPALTKCGYSVVLSDGFYLYAGDDGNDWVQFYEVEPTEFCGSKFQKRRVVGGEACVWTELVNDHNVISVAFPRASAVAERLWSQQSQRNPDEAGPRLEEHNCRMVWRGIETRPVNGFGFC